MRITQRVLVGISIATFAILSLEAPAQPALDFGAAPQTDAGPWVLGWVFTTNTDVEVTGLGWFDGGDLGFNESHAVGIWDSRGVLLVSAVIPAGEASLSENKYRYVRIESITLPARQSFTIGGVTLTDPWVAGAESATGLTTHPAISLVSSPSRYASTSVFQRPETTHFGYSFYGGPNFYMGEITAPPGTSADNPVLPTTQPDRGVWWFLNVASRRWVDPPGAYGFSYEMFDSSLFTEILDFPPGFEQKFSVWVGETLLGKFGPGEKVTFPGAGVSGFRVT